MALISEKHLYQIATTAAAALAGMAVHQVVETIWERMGDEEGADPEDPATGDISWGEALAFAAVSGLLVAVTRVAAKRGAAAGFRRYVGHDPHGV